MDFRQPLRLKPGMLLCRENGGLRENECDCASALQELTFAKAEKECARIHLGEEFDFFGAK
jgi:hypothetical protein